MSARDFSYGYDGTGREFTNSDGKKVLVGAITSTYEIDDHKISDMIELFENNVHQSFMPPLGPEGYELEEGELCFAVDGSDRIMQTLNGLDWKYRAEYPDDPEFCRQLLRAACRPIGYPVEKPQTGYNQKAAVQIAGLRTVGAPSTYNFGPTELQEYSTSPHIHNGCLVVMDIPNLQAPHQFGNIKSGRPAGQVRPVLRSADKLSIAETIVVMQGAVNQDVTKLKTAMSSHTGVLHTWLKTVSAINKSYLTGAIVFLENVLRAGMATIDTARFPELAGPGGAPLSSWDTAVRFAEYLDLVGAGATSTAALAGRRGEWVKFKHEALQRIFQSPNATTRAYNREFQFGYVENPQTGVKSWLGRVGGNGRVKADSMGQFYEMTLSHQRDAYAAIAKAAYCEVEKGVGVAHGAPSPAGESKFPIFVLPHGSVYPHNQ